MKLSENLKRIRKDNNLSQEQLAEKLGVSRQAVSKWESGQSYPEMDKVLLICKLFNYNIDELMNENVKEVDENKQSKVNINKYIEDFFAYITKTVDMFSSIKFRQKLKCLTEQCIIAFILISIFAIIALVGSTIVYGILGRLPSGIYYAIRSILLSIYLILSIGAGTAILLHIFKIRYLDYYEIIKEDDNENIEKEESIESNAKEVENEKKKKIFLEKKKEKIVIRDPEHSQSNFLNGIVRIVLWCIKFMIACLAVCFVFSFVTLITLLVLSFLFIKTGVMFIGTFFTIVSLLIINFIILALCFNFIISKKTNKMRMGILFLISLVLCGVGIGLILIGTTNFTYLNETPESYLVTDSYEFDMKENLSIDSYYWLTNAKFIEMDIDNIKVELKHINYQDGYYYKDENETIYVQVEAAKITEFIRDIIQDINNKQLINYDFIPETTIYASKENIEKLKQNTILKEEQEKQNMIDDLTNSITKLECENQSLEEQLVEKQYTLDENEITITDLEVQIKQKDLEITNLQNQIENLQLMIEQ